MLLKPVDNFKPSKLLNKQFVGVVESNEDPKNLGRVKISIPGLFDIADINVGNTGLGKVNFLPWAYPKLPSESGGQVGSSSVDVPGIGSQVIVEFPFQDVYAPFYVGRWVSSIDLEGKIEDSPNVKVIKDDSGNEKIINKAKGKETDKHSSGIKIEKKPDGSMTISVPKNFKAQSSDGQSQIMIDTATGVVYIAGKDTTLISGKKVEIKPNSSFIIDAGDINMSTKGELVEDVGGGKKTLVGGDDTKSIMGSMAESVTTNKDLLVGGLTNETYGGKVDRTYALGGVLETLLAGSHDLNIVAGGISRTILAGNYSCDVVAGNLSLSTILGTISLSNTLSSIEFDLLGGIAITLASKLDITASLSIALLAPLVTLGPTGSDPAIGFTANPVEDLITGRPKVPSATVFISP